ncbi:hypothetical protein Goklo_024235, partial [Gossypium klotzschianum]|nr:hypothetical protein [Gossypium klotzschianum]
KKLFKISGILHHFSLHPSSNPFESSNPFIPNLKSKEHICTADSRLVCNLQQYLHFTAKTSKNQDKKFQVLTYLKIMNLRMCKTASDQGLLLGFNGSCVVREYISFCLVVLLLIFV